MQKVHNMQIDNSLLLDGIGGAGNTRADSFGTGSVSIGSEKMQETEKLSKSVKTTEVTYQKPQQETKSGTKDDVMQQASNIDAGLMKEKMVVASNTTTTTDCRQIEEEGFSLLKTDMDTIVTVTDKIKMELAKAGVDISYFGDSLSGEQLEDLAGNAALAQELAGRIQQLQADIPLTADNVEDCRKTLQEAEELHRLDDGALKYMLDNQLEPTVSNLYKAQYSGSAVYMGRDGGSAAMGAGQADFQGMKGQVSRIIAQAGMEEDAGTLSDSQWLIRNQIPLTAGNLIYLEQLKSLEFPQDTEKMLDRMIGAIAEGKRPQDALLLDSYSMSGKAQKAVDVIDRATDEDLAYIVSKGEKVTVESLEQAHNQIQAGALSPSEEKEIADLVQSTAGAAADLAQSASEAKNAAQVVSIAADVAQVGIDMAAQAASAADVSQIGTDKAASAADISQIGADAALQAASGDGRVSAVAGNPDPGNAEPGNGQGGSGGMAQSQSLYYTDAQILLVTARRQLEEVRLMMTVEASYAMQKQGILTDTCPMEELISHLKQIEQGYYENLLKEGGILEAQANVGLFAETSDKIEQLKEMPAYALGARNMEVATLEDLHQEGSAMQQNFQQANERYETMQTQIRKDLGDSIKKAFRNVDDILQDMGQEVSPANERAVRILGYNHIEITPENIARMKAADQQVQMAFHNLTPSVIREFINRGVNPLDLDIGELNRQAEQIKTELKIDASEDKFSEYLYKLELNNSITQEERSSYIGIYRLMNQVVRSDGAAVGALVNQGAQITMRNLLAAVRSERHGDIDITVDNAYGELQSGGYLDSITDQIDAGYQDGCVKQAFEELSPERLRNVSKDPDWEGLTPEQFLQQLQEAPEDVSAEEAYYRQQLEDLQKCAKSSEEVYRVLERYDLPNTVLNVMAVSEYMSDRNAAFRRFFGMDNGRRPDASRSTEEYLSENEDGSVEVDFEAMKEELLRRFGEELKKPKELAKAVAELAECAEKCMSTMIIEQDVTSLDIRGLKLMNAQFSVGAKMASSECFSMPIVVDGEVTNVTMKIVRDKQQKGLVNITLETNRLGKIAAEIKARQKGITGYVATDSRQTQDLLKSMDKEIAQALQDVQDGPLDMNYIISDTLDLNHFASRSGSSEEPDTEQHREVQTRTLYGMAEGFIRVLKRLDSAMA